MTPCGTFNGFALSAVNLMVKTNNKQTCIPFPWDGEFRLEYLLNCGLKSCNIFSF